jgi:hypothetical protein
MSNQPTESEVAFLKAAEGFVPEELAVEVEDEGSEVVEPSEITGDQEEIERARAAGWKPLEEYKGPPGKWKDYKAFNDVGDRITKTLQSKITAQEATIKRLIESQAVIIEQAKAQALEELGAQKREAIREGDVAAVDELDKKIAAVTEKHERVKVAPEQHLPQVEQATIDFIEENKAWFQKDQAMTQFASMSEYMERQLDPDADQSVILDRVKKLVVQRFPDKFPQQQRQRARSAPTVESGGLAPRGAEVSFEGYPDEVKRIADFFERTGAMTKKAYFEALKRGGVTK